MKNIQSKNRLQLLLALLLCGIYVNTGAQITRSLHPVTVCLSAPDSTEVPDFDGNNCQQINASSINPQNQEIWIKLAVTINPQLINSDRPLGFFIRGKAASLVYLNDHFLGANGLPGSSATTEQAGSIDVVFYVKKEWVVEGQNQLIMKMSAHQGYLTLGHPINWFGFDHYYNPTTASLHHYWSSLLPFGAFGAAALYFGILTLHNKQKRPVIFLASMAFFAAAQLLFEVVRGVVAYRYPFQDTRLMAILLCSIGFSISLFSHVVSKFVSKNISLAICSVLGLTVLSTFMFVGFDLKTLLAILLPTLCSIVVTVYAALKRQPQALFFTVVLLLFAMVFFVDAADFLDSNFYYLVAILMVFLFVQQAIDHANEKNIRAQQKARADQLQLIIDRHQQKNHPETLKINSAGKIELINIDQIVYGKAAGDYVELVMLDNKTILHHGSLKKLEESLTTLFLKVHRSYLVNTSHIQSLKRHSSGTGELLLTNAHSVPISRRIMPQVREQLV